MTETVTAILTVIGAVVALFASAGPALWHARSERYVQRSRAFRELHEAQMARGSIADPLDAPRAAAAHEEMGAGLDLEARANAAMYMKTAGLLQRPGSLAWALGLITYAIYLTWLTITVLLTPTDNALGLWISVGIIGVIASVLWLAGITQWRRSRSTRWLRLTVGLAEPVNLEALAAMARRIGRWTTSLSRRLFRPDRASPVQLPPAE